MTRLNRNRIKSIHLACVMAIVFPLLSGCWDRLEIEDRAVILGVSIDTAVPEEEKQEENVSHPAGSVPVPERDMIRVAVQIAIPGRIPLGPGESGGAGTSKSSSANTVWVLDVIGHSVDDAFMNLQQQVASRLFFGHLRVIVISEDIARRGLDNINDYFRRNSEIRRMAWMLVSEGPAIDILKATPRLERVPTLYLMATVEEGIRLGKFPKDFIGIFWSNSSKKGQEGFLPYIKLKREKNIELAGLAYFTGNKMTGHTDPIEIGAYLAIKGINPAGYRVFVNLGGKRRTFVTAASHRKSNYSMSFVGGRPHFDVRIALELNIEEKLSDELDIDNQTLLHQIENKQAQIASESFERLVRKTQETGSDIFGFGEYIRAKQPGFWNSRIKTKLGWQEMFKDADFDFHVTMKLRRIGMKGR